MLKSLDVETKERSENMSSHSVWCQTKVRHFEKLHVIAVSSGPLALCRACALCEYGAHLTVQPMVMVALQINDNACGEKYMTVGRMSASENHRGCNHGESGSSPTRATGSPAHRFGSCSTLFCCTRGWCCGEQAKAAFRGNNNTPL